jgi:hypothetical protein
MTEYARTIKKRLLDMDRPQKWLIDEVNKETGLYFDRSYLTKIANGAKTSPKIVEAINRLLKIEGGEA